MKKFLGLAVIGLLSLVLAYAVSADTMQFNSPVSPVSPINTVVPVTPQPTEEVWVLGPFELPSPTPVFEAIVSDVVEVTPVPTMTPAPTVTTIKPQSGYVNGVWVPVYGISCDQLGGSADCMCFYNAPQWCN